jgi:hypothetical protein
MAEKDLRRLDKKNQQRVVRVVRRFVETGEGALSAI